MITKAFDEAAKLAMESDAALKLFDVVPPLPWTARLLLSNHEHMSGLMIREKQEQLEKLAAPIRDEGIDVETKVLNGKSSVEIIREVLLGRSSQYGIQAYRSDECQAESRRPPRRKYAR